MDELPEVDYINTDESGAWAVFDNGAALKYAEEGGVMLEQIYAPSDPHSVMGESKLGTATDTPENYLQESLEYYEQFDSREELARDWSTLAEWINHQ